MKLQRGLLVVGVLGLIGVVVALMATPGSLVTAKYASGEPANREALAALVGLLTLGLLAMGFDFRDWF